jgi:hypothetical protein
VKKAGAGGHAEAGAAEVAVEAAAAVEAAEAAEAAAVEAGADDEAGAEAADDEAGAEAADDEAEGCEEAGTEGGEEVADPGGYAMAARFGPWFALLREHSRAAGSAGRSVGRRTPTERRWRVRPVALSAASPTRRLHDPARTG